MRSLAVVGLVVSILAFGFALLLARRETRVRDLLDAARIATALVAVVLLSTLTGIGTPLWMIGSALVLGLAVGFAEGKNLDVRVSGDVVVTLRSWIGVAVFAAGIVAVQVASIADRSQLIEIGLAVTWFSAALTAGVMIGRRRRVIDSRRLTSVSTGVLTLIGRLLGIVAVAALLVIPIASAQTGTVLDEIADGTYEGTLSNFEFRSSITVISSAGTLTKNGDTLTWSWSVQWEQALVDCAYQDRDSWSGSEITLIDATFVNVTGNRVFEVDLASTCGTPSGDIPSTYRAPMRLDLVGSELKGGIGVGQISFPIVLVNAQATEPTPPVDDDPGTDVATVDDATTTTIDEVDRDVEPVNTPGEESDDEGASVLDDGTTEADASGDDEFVSPGEAAAAGMAAVGLAAATAAISLAGAQGSTPGDPTTDEATGETDDTTVASSRDTEVELDTEAAAAAAAAAAEAAAREARMEELRSRAAELETQRQEAQARRDAQDRADQALRDGTSGLSAARAAGALTLIAEVQALPAPLREVLGAAASPHSRDIAEALAEMHPGQGARVLDGVADVLRGSHVAGTALTATINNGERLVAWAEMRRAGVGVMSDVVGKGLGAIGLLFDIERGLQQGSRIARAITPREIIGTTLDGDAIMSQPSGSQNLAGIVVGGAHVAAHFVATKNPLVLIPDMAINYVSGGRVSIDAALTVVEDSALSGIVWVSEGLGAQFSQWWDQ